LFCQGFDRVREANQKNKVKEVLILVGYRKNTSIIFLIECLINLGRRNAEFWQRVYKSYMLSYEGEIVDVIRSMIKEARGNVGGKTKTIIGLAELISIMEKDNVDLSDKENITNYLNKFISK